MALKDWKKGSHSSNKTYIYWEHKDHGHVTVAKYPEGHKFEGLWVVIGQKQDKGTFNTYIKQFKSKFLAMKAARSYMRDH